MREGVELGTAIACVGEAWGETEEQQRQPFVGASGQELRVMLEIAGVVKPTLTNVFCRRPGSNSNELRHLCTDKPMTTEPPFCVPLAKGLYLKEEHFFQVRELWKELEGHTTVIALGNTAIWALLGQPPAVSRMRGTFWRSRFIKAKVISTYHPAAVIRDWSLRTIVMLDMIKAQAFSGTTEIGRPSRRVCIEPTLADLEDWKKDLLARPLVSIDLELDWPSKKSKERYISCISFSPDPALSYVVPFIKNRWERYWTTLEEECAAWEFVRQICEAPMDKVFQKHLFDTYVLRRLEPRIVVGGHIHDTLHLHHALYPEMPKDLGFMGSVYTEEPAWKLERPKGKGAKEKRDD